MAEELRMPHQVMLEDRERMSVTGVSDVDSFDDSTIVVYTSQGELTVRGDQLHINRLNMETGELSLSGAVVSLTYAEAGIRAQGFFGKLFK